MSNEQAGVICCGLYCCAAVVSVILLAMSFSSLDVQTYGLDYSAIAKTIDPTVRESGIHLLGLMHSFVVYPETIQSFKFSDEPGSIRGLVKARSSDGLMVSFRAEFQYLLNRNQLRDLYFRYGEDYQTPCTRFAVDKMNDVASHYTASTFFKNLQAIQTDMREDLEELLLEECFCRVQTVQLSKADLPSAYEKALQDFTLAQQQVETVKKEQKNVQIEMETEMASAELAAPIVEYAATAKKNAKLANNQAYMDAYYDVTASEAASYKVMKDGLNYKTDDGILNYITVKTIAGYNPDQLILKMEKFT